MARRRVRCPYEVPGGPGDRCRRFKGHEDQSIVHERWHFPDCGGAVTSDGKWTTGKQWVTMFDEVKRAGELIA